MVRAASIACRPHGTALRAALYRESGFVHWPKADPTRPARTGSAYRVHRPRARQAVEPVGAPAFDPGCVKTTQS
jgi:hypothetical protein